MKDQKMSLNIEKSKFLPTLFARHIEFVSYRFDDFYHLVWDLVELITALFY